MEVRLLRPGPGLWTDLRGKIKGDGIDLNTGLTYSLDGDFGLAPDLDLFGPGEFTIKRSDVCTPPRHA